MQKKLTLTVPFLIFCLLPGCAHNPYIFADKEPAASRGDTAASSLPESTDYNLHEYLIASAIRHPLTDSFDFRRPHRSGDVNSMDEVPPSSWYTPRLGYTDLSTEALLKGPEVIGAPQAPFTVYKKKTKGTAIGFQMEDARGHKYLVKLDAADQPGLESTANFVANRLFWAFGYYVPEDYVLYFEPSELKIKEGASLTREELSSLFSSSPREEKGIRATASLFIAGEILGHTSQLGTRKGDTNDVTPHEDLRVLRAHAVFSSLLNNSGIRSDNTLDVYVGEPGRGHTLHYLLDFGETFGVHGLNYLHLWDGNEHFFSWSDSIKRFFTFGARVEPWEKIAPSTSIVDYYRADDFDPATWKEVSQFMPVRKSQPDDDYWAAKIIAPLTRAQLDALFKATAFEDPTLSEQLAGNFMKRRDKWLGYAFSKVTPLEAKNVTASELVLQDKAYEFLGSSTDNYEVHYFNEGQTQVSESIRAAAHAGTVQIPLPNLASDYLRIEISRDAHARPAQFHLRKSAGKLKLVGVVH